MAPCRRATLTALGLLTLAGGVLAIGQDTCVTFKSSPSTFAVVNSGKAAPILLSPDEWPGVQRAASDFASDIESVTGVKPTLTNITLSLTASVTKSTSFRSRTPIIVGTLGKSSLIDEVVNRTKLDVSSIQGKWEAFMAKEVKNPLPGVSSAYVVIGADKRGTIFALYDHSEQFGAFIRRVMCVTSAYSSFVVVRQVSRLGTGESHAVLFRSNEAKNLTLIIGGQTCRRQNTMRCS